MTSYQASTSHLRRKQSFQAHHPHLAGRSMPPRWLAILAGMLSPRRSSDGRDGEGSLRSRLVAHGCSRQPTWSRRCRRLRLGKR